MPSGHERHKPAHSGRLFLRRENRRRGRAQLAEGGSLSTDVGYNIESSGIRHRIRPQDFALAGTLPYFRQSLDVTAVDGRLSADIRLRGNTEHLLRSRPRVRLRWRASPCATGSSGPWRASIRWCKTRRGRSGKMRFVFDRIYVSGLSALFEMTPEGNNLAALMKSRRLKPLRRPPFPSLRQRIPLRSSPAPTAEITTSAVPPWRQKSRRPTPREARRQSDAPDRRLEISNGRVSVRDLTMHRPFEYTVSKSACAAAISTSKQQHDRRCADARPARRSCAEGRSKTWTTRTSRSGSPTRPARLRSLLRTLHAFNIHDQGQPHVPQSERHPRPLPRRHQPPRHVRARKCKAQEIKAEMNIPLKLGPAS